MSYIGLGSRGPLNAALDTTQLNKGNLTNYFDAAALTAKVPYYEIYSMSVTGLTIVGNLIVYVSGKIRTTAKLFGNSEWDPQQPILMTPQDEIVFAWDFSSGSTPAVTLWLRYDPALNRGMV